MSTNNINSMDILHDYVASAVFASLVRIAGGGADDVANINSACKSKWLEELKKIAYSSVSFPNNNKQSKNKTINRNMDGVDGKPHDLEVRAALSLFHRSHHRGMQQQSQRGKRLNNEYIDAGDGGSSISKRGRRQQQQQQQHKQQQQQNEEMTKDATAKQDLHSPANPLLPSNEFKKANNSSDTFEITSDLGTRREIDSVNALATLLSLELEQELSARNLQQPCIMEKNNEIGHGGLSNNNPIDNDEFYSFADPFKQTKNQTQQQQHHHTNVTFFDIRPNDSGIICLVSNERSIQLRAAGKIPCSHCVKWFKGTKGLWWHQLSAHGIEYSSAAESAALEVNPLAIVKFGDGSMPSLLIEKGRMDTQHDNQRDGNASRNFDAFEMVKCGKFDDFVKLVEGGFRPDIELDRNGASTLHWAAGCGHSNFVSYLTENLECNPNEGQQGKRSFMGRTPLHWAARNGHLTVVKFLVDDCHADIDAETTDGTTAFCWAAWQGHLDVMKFLQERSCNIHKVNSFGCNAVLWCAQGTGTTEILSWLFSSGSNFNIINSNGHSALHKAAQRGSSAVCKWLVDTFLVNNVTDVNGFLFIGPDTEGACPSDLCGMEGHSSLAHWISKQECGFIGRLCTEISADTTKGELISNQRFPTWLLNDMHPAKAIAAKFGYTRSQWGANFGVRRMALNILEYCNCDASSRQCENAQLTMDLKDID